MPIVMQRQYVISGNYTAEQMAQLATYIDEFRLRIADDDAEKNILDGRQLKYTDDKIVQFLLVALNDLNGGIPKTNYTIFDFQPAIEDDLLIEGAIVFALIAEGLLQLKNQVDYSDSGLSIAMFNKTGAYQGWTQFFLQTYLQDKAEMKRTIIPRSSNSGFVGFGGYGERGWSGW